MKDAKGNNPLWYDLTRSLGWACLITPIVAVCLGITIRVLMYMNSIPVTDVSGSIMIPLFLIFSVIALACVIGVVMGMVGPFIIILSARK